MRKIANLIITQTNRKFNRVVKLINAVEQCTNVNKNFHQNEQSCNKFWNQEQKTRLREDFYREKTNLFFHLSDTTSIDIVEKTCSHKKVLTPTSSNHHKYL